MTTEAQAMHEKDPSQVLVEAFLHDMGIISRTLGAMSLDLSDHHISRNHEAAKKLQEAFPDITNHAIKGSTIHAVPIKKSWGQDNFLGWFPWGNGKTVIDPASVVGTIEEIFPGIGIYIENTGNREDARFIAPISRIDSKPSVEIKILS